jgi:hypothetical protein
MMMTNSDNDRYRIKDWSPPWLDNGDALLEVIAAARQMDNPISWQIICSLIRQQIEIDLKIAREVNYMFNPDVNEDALPYAWEADIQMKHFGPLWEVFPESDEDEEDGD